MIGFVIGLFVIIGIITAIAFMISSADDKALEKETQKRMEEEWKRGVDEWYKSFY